MSYLRRIAASALVLAAIAASTSAHEIPFGDLVIQHPWARPSIGNAPNGAIYMRIVNKGAKPDRLIAIETPAADHAELHRHEQSDGVMRMRAVEGGIEIPAGGSVTLAPGGLHVMLFALKKPLRSGFGVPLTLTFAQAGKVEMTAVIAQAGQDFKAYGEH